MSTITHIESLQRKRNDLKTAIREEMKSPNFNEQRILELKKTNLRLKDEILMLYKQAS